MRRLLFLNLILLLATTLFAGSYNEPTVNAYNKAGKKEGKWIIYGKDKPTEGYPANGKIEEGNYLNGRKEGQWIKYHLDGKTPRLIGNYRDNRPFGSYSKFSEKGTILEKGTFKNSQYSDTLTRYHENGKIAYKGNYQAGKENGKIKYFYENGKVEYEYTAVAGVVVGKSIRYYETGSIKEIIEQDSTGSIKNREIKREEVIKPILVNPDKSGELAPKITRPIVKNGRFLPNGYNKVYNEDDEIWQDGDFVDGRLFDGKLYVYDRDGILLKVKVFKNGIYHSDGQL